MLFVSDVSESNSAFLTARFPNFNKFQEDILIRRIAKTRGRAMFGDMDRREARERESEFCAP
jgi:hypothetical protein